MITRRFYFRSLVGILLASSLLAQPTSKWIAVGQLHNWFSNLGCEIEVGRTGQIPDQQDGLRWPAQFSYQDCQAAKSMWIGTINYYDPLVDKTFDYKVVHVGPRGPVDHQKEMMPQKFTLYGRHAAPTVVVDGDIATNMQFMDSVDSVDTEQNADRKLVNIVNTAIGVTVKRTISAFSNQYHDNYHIYEFEFENTGVYDRQGSTQSVTLEDVYFHWQYRYAASREGGPYGSNYWLPQNTAWGANTVNQVIGEDPDDGDPFRAGYSWHGLHSGAGFDNVGAPYFGEGGDGHLSAQQFMGFATLHADVSSSDPSDDPLQPSTTWWVGSDWPITQNNDQFNASKMLERYQHMSVGHPELSHADQLIAESGTPWGGLADQWGDDPGGYSQGQGFGPYQLAPGDRVHITIVEGAAGLSRDKCYEIGENWFSPDIALGDLTLPGGGAPASKDEYKNYWVFTGYDSLMQTFTRAQSNYLSGYDIPKPPPPPDQFNVTSGGDRITLSWTNNAEAWSGFRGYKLYRAMHKPDTTFEEIFSCEVPNIVNSFDDVTAIRGFDYYYYIVTYDDGNTNDIEPGAPLYSSLFYTRTNKPASLKRPPGTSLDDIRVVPNPYNIRALELQYGSSGADRIMFLDIPPVCTIRIFTERGDLIETIEHTDGSGDEAWNSITKHRQVVVSGIYLAHFETPEGESTYRKFIVIR